MENNNLRNSNQKDQSDLPKTNSVTDIYYGNSLITLNLGKNESNHLWSKLSNIFHKSNSSTTSNFSAQKSRNLLRLDPATVKIFRDAKGSNQHFFKRENLNYNSIRPVANNQKPKYDKAVEDIGVAMGIELPPSESNESFVVTVELENFKNAEARVNQNLNKATMKLSEISPSRSVFTGIMKLRSDTDTKKLGQIPLYVVDSKERIIANPKNEVCYRTLIRNNKLDCKNGSDIKIRFQLEKITSYWCSFKPKKFASSDCMCSSKSVSKSSLESESEPQLRNSVASYPKNQSSMSTERFLLRSNPNYSAHSIDSRVPYPIQQSQASRNTVGILSKSSGSDSPTLSSQPTFAQTSRNTVGILSKGSGFDTASLTSRPTFAQASRNNVGKLSNSSGSDSTTISSRPTLAQSSENHVPSHASDATGSSYSVSQSNLGKPSENHIEKSSGFGVSHSSGQTSGSHLKNSHDCACPDAPNYCTEHRLALLSQKPFKRLPLTNAKPDRKVLEKHKEKSSCCGVLHSSGQTSGSLLKNSHDCACPDTPNYCTERRLAHLSQNPFEILSSTNAKSVEVCLNPKQSFPPSGNKFEQIPSNAVGGINYSSGLGFPQHIAHNFDGRSSTAAPGLNYPRQPVNNNFENDPFSISGNFNFGTEQGFAQQSKNTFLKRPLDTSDAQSFVQPSKNSFEGGPKNNMALGYNDSSQRPLGSNLHNAHASIGGGANYIGGHEVSQPAANNFIGSPRSNACCTGLDCTSRQIFAISPNNSPNAASNGSKGLNYSNQPGFVETAENSFKNNCPPCYPENYNRSFGVDLTPGNSLKPSFANNAAICFNCCSRQASAQTPRNGPLNNEPVALNYNLRQGFPQTETLVSQTRYSFTNTEPLNYNSQQDSTQTPRNGPSNNKSVALNYNSKEGFTQTETLVSQTRYGFTNTESLNYSSRQGVAQTSANNFERPLLITVAVGSHNTSREASSQSSRTALKKNAAVGSNYNYRDSSTQACGNDFERRNVSVGPHYTNHDNWTQSSWKVDVKNTNVAVGSHHSNRDNSTQYYIDYEKSVVHKVTYSSSYSQQEPFDGFSKYDAKDYHLCKCGGIDTKTCKQTRNELPNGCIKDSFSQYSKTDVDNPFRRKTAVGPDVNYQDGSSQYVEIQVISVNKSKSKNACTQYIPNKGATKEVDVHYSMLMPSLDFYNELFQSDSFLYPRGIAPASSVEKFDCQRNDLSIFRNDDSLTWVNTRKNRVIEPITDNAMVVCTRNEKVQTKRPRKGIKTNNEETSTVLQAGTSTKPDTLTIRVKNNQNLQPDSDIAFLEKAQSRLTDFLEKRCYGGYDEPFTNQEIVQICRILQSGNIAKKITLKKALEAARETLNSIQKKTKKSWSFLEVSFGNSNQSLDIPVTKFQFNFISDPQNPTTLKPWQSLVAQFYTTPTEGTGDANTNLTEEFTSVQLAYNKLSTTFNELGLTSTAIVEDTQYSETIENMADNLSHTIVDLMTSLDIIEQALQSAEPLSNFDQPWLQSLEKVVDNYFVECKETDNPFRAPNQTLHKHNSVCFSEKISKPYSEVEDDVKNIIGELLKQTEEIKSVAILNGIQEESDPPFSSNNTDLLTPPRSIPECKSIKNINLDSTSDYTCTSSDNESGRSQCDVQNNSKSGSKRICYAMMREVGSDKLFRKAIKLDKVSLDNGKTCYQLNLADLENNKKELTYKIGEFKNRITYSCNSLVRKIPKTSLNFKENSQKKSSRTRSTGKAQTKKKDRVAEKIISGDTIEAKNEIANQICCHAINKLQVNIESNINVCTCTFVDKEDNDNASSVSYSTTIGSSRCVPNREMNVPTVISQSRQSSSQSRDPDRGSEFMPHRDATPQTVSSNFNIHFQSMATNISDHTVSSGSSSLTSKKVFRSQKLFNVSDRFDSDDGEDEEVANNIDLTLADPSRDTNSDNEILIKVQNLAKSHMNRGQQSNGKSSHSSYDVKEPKLEVIAVKPNNESYSTTTAADGIYEDSGASSSTLSHPVPRTARSSMKFMKIQKEIQAGEHVTSSEVELSTQETFSNEDLSSETSQKSNSFKIQLNLPVVKFKSQQVLSTAEEIACIEENVRANDLLAQRQQSSSESSGDDDQIYSDAETIDPSDENKSS